MILNRVSVVNRGVSVASIEYQKVGFSRDLDEKKTGHPYVPL